ncbi:hypothetical protein TNCV_1911081 [Trichonephila clavipes]|nr:hypothetical protein TNCV_1911081 [Trichonephila clavipes]
MDEDDTCAGIFSLNYHTTRMEGVWALMDFQRSSDFLQSGSSVELGCVMVDSRYLKRVIEMMEMSHTGLVENHFETEMGGISKWPFPLDFEESPSGKLY